MSSLADFNFSGDDPGPSTDPTVDPVDADPMSEGEPNSEEAYDDTNYKEPGLGEEFAGNEPTAFDSEGNADSPNIQKSDVVPIEVEAESVTKTNESNPVERDLDKDMEEALNLLVNLGLGDFVTGIIDEILEDESELEPEEVGRLQRIQDWVNKLQDAAQDIREFVATPGLDKIDGVILDQISDFFGSYGDIGSGYIDELRRARQNINSTIPTQSNFWGSLSRNAALLHRLFNGADDEDQLEPEDDQGDIDEAEGSTSPNDTDLEFIGLDDWLGIGPDQQDNVDYVDLNDYLSPDMHTVDEFVDLNDYMGDMIQESFLEEFMFVAQEEI